LIALGIADFGSIPAPPLFLRVAAVALAAPAIYAAHSTLKHFGMARATGADHFRAEYRDMEFVREGAFQYTGNAMYGMVFLGFWAIALFTGSMAALAVAAFQHAAIWVHYYCTEKPDIALIYGQRKSS